MDVIFEAYKIQSGMTVNAQRLFKFLAALLKEHKHEIFYTFLAETKSLWSHGPVTQDF